MWNWARELPEQLAAEPRGLEGSVAPDRTPRRILVCGMGGSGVSAQFLAALGPFIPWRWAGAPDWLGPEDALLAVSYSGETCETLRTVRDALGRHSAVYGVTGGGELARLLDQHGASRLSVPGDMPPRAAFGHLLGACLRLGGRLLGTALWRPDAVVAELRASRDGLADDDYTWLAGLARALAGRQLVVYGTCPLSAAAALRWKQQLNENAKQFCWCNALPEAAHNEVEAAGPGDPPRRIVLTLGDEAPPLDTVLDDYGDSVVLTAPSGPAVFRALHLVLLGDLLSLLIARERAVDPGGIPRIAAFKQTGWARRFYGGDT